MKCPVCGTPWSMLDKSPVHPFGGWVTHCFCQHVVPGSPLYPAALAPRSERREGEPQREVQLSSRAAFFVGMAEAARMVESQDVSGLDPAVKVARDAFAECIRVRATALESLAPAAPRSERREGEPGDEHPAWMKCSHGVLLPLRCTACEAPPAAPKEEAP